MLLKNWMNAIFFILIPVALLLTGFWAGTKVESASAAKEKLALVQGHANALAKAFSDYEVQIDAQREKDKEVIDGYVSEMAKIERRYRELARGDRLRLPRAVVCGANALPAIPPGEPVIDEGVAPTVVLPERVEEDLRQLAREADEVTAQCRSVLQVVEAD